MTKIKILRDHINPLTDEETELVNEFGLDNVFDVDPIPAGTVIKEARISTFTGEAYYNHPDAKGEQYIPWYSEPDDYEVVTED